MLHALETTDDNGIRFQSSPAPKGRCYFPAALLCLLVVAVSILTGPEGPVLLSMPIISKESGRVSILTGPEGPVLLSF